MDITKSQDPVACFTLELLRGGLMLSGLASDLIEALAPEDYPGEQPGEVVVEMITGTRSTPARGRVTPAVAAPRA